MSNACMKFNMVKYAGDRNVKVKYEGHTKLKIRYKVHAKVIKGQIRCWYICEGQI